MLAGKTHNFNGHFPVRYVKLPEGNEFPSLPETKTLHLSVSMAIFVDLWRAFLPHFQRHSYDYFDVMLTRCQPPPG